ncbi:MAG: phage portal protein [Alphaproteobacteria bacterium]|nr:phage portal protein [Alphaproteobacteria bacterium]MBT5390616.1 phage portal protein [Alphaproteobacteria bacterium]MBT5654719.1 phage portal protein [Alphaproteobacteria bacterium]
MSFRLRTKKHKKFLSSHQAKFVTCAKLGQPVWTPRRYDQLSEEGYQKNVIVYRAVTLIARSIAGVSWILYGGKHQLDSHGLLRLLNCPSPNQAGSALLESLVSHYLLSGNAYLEAVYPRRNSDVPVELHALRPDRMRIIPGRRGMPCAYVYRVNESERSIGVDPVTNKSPILHLKNFHPLNDWYGMSPIEAAARAIDQHNAVGSHNLALLQNGGRPSGALQIRSQQPMTEEQRESLRQDLNEGYQGTGNSGRILILEGDFDWKEMGLSPKNMDFLEGKNVTAREIAQAFGVPPILVGVPGDATYANYREARYHLWEETILPLMELITAELNQWLVPQFGEDLRLDFDKEAIPSLVRRRESLWERLNQADFLTPNEKRAAVGYGPLPGGDGFSMEQESPHA